VIARYAPAHVEASPSACAGSPSTNPKTWPTSSSGLHRQTAATAEPAAT
jgi:hypothetical protein